MAINHNIAVDSSQTTASSLACRIYCATTSPDTAQLATARIYYRQQGNSSWILVGTETNSSYPAYWTTNYMTRTGLLASTTYEFYGRFWNSAGAIVATTNTISATTSAAPVPVPATPSPSLHSRTTTSLSFSWASVAHATSYRVYLNGVMFSSGASSPYSFSGLAVGTSYTFGVQAVNSSGASQIGYVSASTLGTIPPTPSGGVVLSTRGINSLAVYWNSSTDATSYTLRYRAYNATNGSLGSYVTFSTTGTTYTLTSLTAGCGYELSVCANNSYGSSAYSGTSIATTFPATPSLSAPSTTATSISVNVASLSGYADTIYIFRYSSGGSTVLETKTLNGSNGVFSGGTVSFTGLASETTYGFKAEARRNTPTGSVLAGALSATILATTQGAVPNAPSPYQSSATATSVTVSWANVSTATSYRLILDGFLVTTSATSPYTINNLIADKSYSVGVQAVNANGQSTIAYVSCTTLSGLPPTPSGGVVLSTRGINSLAVYWNSSTDATSYTLRYRAYNATNGSLGSYVTFSTTGTTYTLSNLTAGCGYELTVCANNSYGSSAYSNETIATTFPDTPSLSMSTTTSTSITISVASLSGYADVVYINRYASGGSTILETKTLNGSSGIFSGGNVSFTGLVSGTTYDFRADARRNTPTGTVLIGALSGILSIKCGSARPLDWAWTSNITAGQNFSITAVEWNNFTARINLFRVYKGLSNYSFTSVSSGNTFTATIFNQARTAISNMSPPTALPSSATQGGDCLASMFNGLRNSLNSIV